MRYKCVIELEVKQFRLKVALDFDFVWVACGTPWGSVPAAVGVPVGAGCDVATINANATFRLSKNSLKLRGLPGKLPLLCAADTAAFSKSPALLGTVERKPIFG